MNHSHRCASAFAAVLCAALPAIAVAPVAGAEPAEDASAGPVDAPAVQVYSVDGLGSVDADAPVSMACKQFGAAIDLAASNYEEFAYATAGNGNAVNYQDPNVIQSNVLGRTALREAARGALDAAGTPGLPPDVAEPMRSWSIHATKLLLIMGVRGGGDSLNSTANQMNIDTQNAQMACALNGARG